MATPVVLPRGILEVKWKKDGKTQTRYRVRIKRKDVKADEFFELLDDAKTFLHEKTVKKASTSLLPALQPGFANLEVQELLLSVVRPQTIGTSEIFTVAELMQEYTLRRFRYEIPEFAEFSELPERRRLALYNETNKNAVIAKTLLNLGKTLPNQEGAAFPVSMPFVRKDGSKIYSIKLGELYPEEINYDVAMAYVEARRKVRINRKKLAGSTIKREVDMISAFLSDYAKKRNAKDLIYSSFNPLSGAIPLEEYRIVQKKHPRITEEIQEKLFKVLTPHVQLLQIVHLGLLTGMRKSEILILTTKHRDGNYLHLSKEETKSKTARDVYLIDEAVSILDSIVPQPDGKYFTYTLHGFNTMRYKVFKQIGVPGLTFHTLRGEYISRILRLQLGKELERKMARVGNAKYFDENFRQKELLNREPQTLEETANQSGHSLKSNILQTTYDRSAHSK